MNDNKKTEQYPPFDETKRAYSVWYREWVVGISPAVLNPTDATWAYRVANRHTKWAEMVGQFWKDNKALAEKFGDVPFYVRAALFYERNGWKEFERWMREPAPYEKKPIPEGNIGEQVKQYAVA